MKPSPCRRAVPTLPIEGTARALADQMVIVQPVLGHLGARFELSD